MSFERFVSLIMITAVIAAVTTCTTTRSSQVRPPHHTDTGFRNIYNNEHPGLIDFVRWRFSRLRNPVSCSHGPAFPRHDTDHALLENPHGKTTVTWIGHATLFLSIGGETFITDPHFSERASPFQWAGPRRVVPPGVALDDLPPIDFVLISHDHYDSLDTESITRIARRPGGDKTVYLVPLGLKKWFTEQGIDRVFELDWWDEYQRDEYHITAVPLQHWSKRSIFSQNHSLWAGWVIKTDTFRFFFCGDTGYCPHFREIGERLGPFDLSAIPIGAYEPRWFMKNHHVNPDEAVQIHKDVRSRLSIAIHWGTFILTDEPLDEPPRLLSEALAVSGLPPESFITLTHGETIILDDGKK